MFFVLFIFYMAEGLSNFNNQIKFILFLQFKLKVFSHVGLSREAKNKVFGVFY